MRADSTLVLPLLRDPVDYGPLRIDGQRLIGQSSGRVYTRCQGQPLLVDFSQSVLEEASFEDHRHVSLVNRKRSRVTLWRRLKEMLSPEKLSTVRNVAHFIRALESQTEPIALVIGGGSIGQGTAALYGDARIRWVAFDLYPTDHTHFIADAHAIPIADESLDGVVIQAVLEHVIDPQRVVDEIWRVLRPNGVVYAETPFIQHVHEGAYDFTRFTESGHRYLFRGFELLEGGVSGGAGTQMTWSIDFLARGVFRSRRAGKFFKGLFFWLHFLDRVIPESYNSDAASGFYLLGRKSDVKLTPREIVKFYRGAQR